MGKVNVPHFALPFRFDTISVASGVSVVAVVENEQDSLEDIADCVVAVLSYSVGYRIEKPNFGIPDQVFMPGGADPTALTPAIVNWEPRAESNIVESPDAIDELWSRVRVDLTEREEVVERA